jgi:hypothetical protein
MREHEQEVLTVLEEFFVSTESGYINPRADDEIAKYRKFIEDGKRGAAKRWLKGPDSPPIASPIATPIATTNHKPITNNHKPIDMVLCPDGLDVSVWQDWLKIRKSKKAPLTATAWKLFVNECEKANWTIEDAIKECCLRNWASFKADWMKEKQQYNKFDVSHVTTPPPPNQDAALRKIEEDRKNAAPPSLAVLAKMAELRKSMT